MPADVKYSNPLTFILKKSTGNVMTVFQLHDAEMPASGDVARLISLRLAAGDANM